MRPVCAAISEDVLKAPGSYQREAGRLAGVQFERVRQLGLVGSIARRRGPIVDPCCRSRETWLSMLPPSIITEQSPETGEWHNIPDAVATSYGWLTADGDVLSKEEARKVASDAGSAG
jgi:hypothetical protein